MFAENSIHPTAIVDSSVRMGIGNYVGPYCLIGPNVEMGDNNRFEAHCSVGTAPEHKEYWNGEYQSVRIGSECVIREFVTINSGIHQNTCLADRVICLRGSHVGHDSVIESDVTISCNVLIGGHSIIYRNANLGLGAILHQYSVIGHYAMIGMGTIVTKTSAIEPCKVYVGNPAVYLKVNQVGIDRNHLTSPQVKACLDEFYSTKEKKSAS